MPDVMNACLEELRRTLRIYVEKLREVYSYYGNLPHELGFLRDAVVCAPVKKLFKKPKDIINIKRALFPCPADSLFIEASTGSANMLREHGIFAGLYLRSSTKVYYIPSDNVSTIEESMQRSWVCFDPYRRIQALVSRIPSSASDPAVAQANYTRYRVYLEGLADLVAEPFRMTVDDVPLTHDILVTFLNTGGATSSVFGTGFTLAMLARLREYLGESAVKHISIMQLPVDAIARFGANSVNVRTRLQYALNYVRGAGRGAVIVVEPSTRARASGAAVQDFRVINDVARYLEATSSNRDEVLYGAQFSDLITSGTDAIANNQVFFTSRVMTIEELNRKVESGEPVAENLLVGQYLREAVRKLSGEDTGLSRLSPREAYLIIFGPPGAMSGLNVEKLTAWVGCDVSIVPVEVLGTATRYALLLVRYDVPLLKAFENPGEFFS